MDQGEFPQRGWETGRVMLIVLPKPEYRSLNRVRCLERTFWGLNPGTPISRLALRKPPIGRFAFPGKTILRIFIHWNRWGLRESSFA
jgi:hypothetical protein